MSPQKWTVTLWGMNLKVLGLELNSVFRVQFTLMDKPVGLQDFWSVSLFCRFLIHRSSEVILSCTHYHIPQYHIFFSVSSKHFVVTSSLTFLMPGLQNDSSHAFMNLSMKFFFFFILTLFALTKPLKMWPFSMGWVGLDWRTTRALQ